MTFYHKRSEISNLYSRTTKIPDKRKTLFASTNLTPVKCASNKDNFIARNFRNYYIFGENISHQLISLAPDSCFSIRIPDKTYLITVIAISEMIRSNFCNVKTRKKTDDRISSPHHATQSKCRFCTVSCCLKRLKCTISREITCRALFAADIPHLPEPYRQYDIS